MLRGLRTFAPLCLLLGCAYRHEPHGLHEAIFPNPREVVMEWTAALQPLGPEAAKVEAALPFGGPALLASAAAAPYLARPDVASSVARRAEELGTSACARAGGDVKGWHDGLPVCCLSPGAVIPRLSPPAAIQPPAGAPVALEPSRSGALVSWGERTCNAHGKAIVGWTRSQGALYVVCGGGSGGVVPWIAESPDPLVDACAADLDQDGLVELAVVVGSGGERRVDVLDGDRTWELANTAQAGEDAARSVACRPGRVAIGNPAVLTEAWAWDGDVFRTMDLPG